VNPRHPLDARYEQFLDSIAEELSRALVKVRAYQEEIKRAEALAELDRAKTAFFSNVSHEFRTPLTLLLGPLEELLGTDGALPGKSHEIASVAYRNGLRLQKLVNSLLDFSRIEAGRVQASFEPVDLAALTAEIASTFRSAAEKAGLQLLVECPPLGEPVYLDRDMWEKVVLNLLSNAVKYTFIGTIAVSLQRSAEHAVLTVEDTGTGIPAQELPKLFERFHRVEGARGRTQEGTGIGLALVAELVKLHGGKIEVRSAFGAGSTFTVSVPLGRAHLPPDRVPAEPRARHARPPNGVFVEEAVRWLPETRKPSAARRASAKVLIADDNADMRDYLCRLLSELYEVEAVTNGEEALACALDNPPDLVLSDVMMPALDGFGLLDALRRKPETSTLPVILLSARAGEEARVEGLDAGATDYLVKPFTARELLARIRGHLEMARLRKQAAIREEALRAQAQAERDRAIGILESLADGFFTLDRTWQFTYINPAAERLLRTNRAEVLGKSAWDLYPRLLGTNGEREFRRAARDRVPVRFEIFNESWRQWFSVNASPDQGDGLSVNFRDVTESKRAEIDLRKQWQAFDTALSHTPDFTYIFDLEGRFTYVNRALLSLWQKSLDEAVGKNFFELDYPSDLAGRLQHQIQQVIETRDPVRDQTPYTGPTGETRSYEYIFVPIVAGDGRVEAVAGSTRDITERDRIEKALAASKQRLQQVFTQAPVPIIVFRGRDFIVELANPPYQALLKGRDFLGRPFAAVIPELAQGIWDVLHRVFDTGEPFIANEWPVSYDSDGDGLIEDHWFNVLYHPLSEVDGKVSGVIAVLTDVTVQVLARQTVEGVNRELEEFAFAASHDLQEPLRMVNSYTQLLLRRHIDPDNADAQQFAAFIHQGVRRMELLIRDLLSYSRALHRDDVLATPENTTADLNASWAEAVSVMSGSIAESDARITVDPLPTVRGDTVQMSHVFQNLLSNALKYRKQTVPPDIRVSAEPRDGKWTVAVRDNGIGFEQKYAERIFGLFKRLHRDEYPGTGLGLAICQRIVERYRGRIWAESEPDLGSTFFVELPAVH
jgi:PAS domain S-box-containing protein